MRVLISLCLCLLIGATVPLAQERIPRGDRAKMRETRETLRALHLDLTTYHQLNGEYPAELKALVDNQLREAVPKDAWGREFNYSIENGKFKLVSYGADGKPGGKLGAADITWTETGEHRELSADEKAERDRLLAEQRFEATKLLARRRMIVVASEVVDFRREQGKWPANIDECKRSGTEGADLAVNACFDDPFEHGFKLKQLPKENFAVVCYGADGEEDGTGHDADFVVTEREVRKEYNDWRDYWGYDPYNNDWQVENLANDITHYKERFGELPTELDDLTRGGQGPNGPLPAIRNSIPQDRWGNQYVLVVVGEDFYVAGLGQDRLEGGVKDNADVIYPVPGKFEEVYEEWEEPMPEQDDDEILHEIALELVNDVITNVNEYHAENENYPDSLAAVADKFPDNTVPLDPWEHSFVYALTKDAEGAATGFTVTCYGSDGAEGGESWAADIVLNQAYEPQ